MKKRKWVCLYVCGRSKVKKTFSMFFYFRILCRKNMVLIGFKGQKNASFRVQRSKEHFLPGSKVKKTLPSGFKGQKNIFFDFSTFAFYVEISWSWSGSKVKRTLPSGLSIEKARAVLVQRSWVESQKR
jgi:hypothetical protein